MFLIRCLAIVSASLGMGLRTLQAETAFEDRVSFCTCPEIQEATYLVGHNSITVPLAVKSCHCNGGLYDDGTPCKKRAFGHDGERTWKMGTCLGGECILTVHPFGCNGPRPTFPANNPPVGCAFTCLNTSTNEREWGYLPVNTTCLHYVNDTAKVLGTCQSFGKRVLCREMVEDPSDC